MGLLKYLVVVAIIATPASFSNLPEPDVGQVHNVSEGEIPKRYTFDGLHGEQFLEIFCRQADSKSLRYYFRTARLRIVSSSEDIKIFKGATSSEVYFKYLSTSKWYLWAADLLPWRVREASFPTFNSSCIGVATSQGFSAMLLIRPIDPWNFALFIGGIILFLLSPRLTESTMFFYTSGTLLGAVAAVLVMLFILSRALPKGKVSYITISILWSMCLYFAGESWNRLEELFHEKLPYILVYLTTGAVIAFITCYRLGPPTHPRTLDIIRWFLQLVSLWLIHLSSELVEVSTAIIVIILFSYHFAGRLILCGRGLWRRVFPAQVRLLTEEEYIAEGARETEKSLRQLREYCSSPECNSWKIVSRLKDPRRFASFMDGSSHLSDEELMSYETEIVPEDAQAEETSDEDDESNGRDENHTPTFVPRSPSRQGTPRPPLAPATPANQNNSRRLRSRSKPKAGTSRAAANEYLTDDESPDD
ncbi:unnamed protein product [Allacma fusca]|uniref:Nuclear envelope integral membrane protein 1 n=1 Tax=Allacma fusca TaxID=39272 RepID=A0A8J2NH23_9HEXA|nr:unnamed protein product [Allacma fusca]